MFPWVFGTANDKSRIVPWYRTTGKLNGPENSDSKKF